MSHRLIRNTGMIVALMFGLLAIAGRPAAAQDSTPVDATPAVEQPVVVGETEITWTGEWEFDAETSTDDNVTFTQIDIENLILKFVSYGVSEDEALEDPEQIFDGLTEGIAEGAGVDSAEESGAGELEDGTLWRIYTLELLGIQVSLLVTVAQNDDGAFVVSSLTTNTASFGDTFTQVQEEFTLNEDTQLFGDLDVAEVTEGLPIGATPEASPASTPAA